MSQNFIKRLLGKKDIAQSNSITQANNDTFTVKLPDFTHDAGGRVRTSFMNTLFDGKLLNQDNPEMWHGVGTGVFSFTNNISNMSVTSGQYYIRLTNRHFPYYSGKCQLIEWTMEDFHLQAGVEKDFGYYSSSSTAPYNTTYDGFMIVNTGTTYELKVYNNGTLITSIDWTNWTNYSKISSYDFSKFTVFASDFLWLGGATLNIYLKTPTGFVLLHNYSHAGVGDSCMFKSPNQPIRYGIRSSSGTGTYSPICSQVASEGGTDEKGYMLSYFNSTVITCNNIGTIYALRSFKKQAAFRDMAVSFIDIGIINTATTDSGIGMIIKNPTPSSAISYANNNVIQLGTPTNQTITANTGKVICSFIVSSYGGTYILPNQNDIYMQNRIDDVMAEYVIAYTPLSANQSLVTTSNILVM